MKLITTTLLTAGILMSASWAHALPFGADDHPRHAAGKHATYHTVPWAAAPEQRPSQPIPEPNGLILFGVGCLVASCIMLSGTR